MLRIQHILIIALLLGTSSLLANGPLGSDQMRKYIETIRGTWISMEGEGVNSSADLLVHVSPTRIVHGQAAIAVSQYYQHDLAEELLFRLDGRHLKMTGAIRNGKYVPMERLEFATIWWEKEGRDSILYFESCEMEHQAYTFLALRRFGDGRPAPDGWACGLQGAFTAFLRLGKYTVERPDGKVISLAKAFGTEAPIEELMCLEEYSGLWPMYEEDCVCSEFDIVLLGSLQPGGSAAFFAIEWQNHQILLYKTLRSEESGDLIQKGPLALIIRPAFEQSINLPLNIRSS